MYQKEKLDDEYSESLLLKLKQFNLHDNETIIKAMRFAKFYHKGQPRKSGEPYYMHPVAVAEITLKYAKNPDIIASALMHDVVEDTIATIEMIEKDFGYRIAQMIDRLTRDRPDGSKLSVEIILNNAYRFKDKDVLLIKIIDRLHNLRTLDSVSEKKQIKTIKESLVYFMSLATVTDMHEISYLIYDECLKNNMHNERIDYISIGKLTPMLLKNLY